MARKTKEQLHKEEIERLQGAIEYNLERNEDYLRKCQYELGALLYQESTTIERINDLKIGISKTLKEIDCLKTIIPEDFSEKYFDVYLCAGTDWSKDIEPLEELLNENTILEYIGQKYGLNKLLFVDKILKGDKNE